MKLTIQRMARIAILSALAVGLRSAFIGFPFSTEFSWIIVMASYLRAVLPLLFLAFFMILIMQYRRFYSIHLFSLFLGDF